MNNTAANADTELEHARFRVMKRLAALLSTQIRSQRFTSTAIESIHFAQTGIAARLRVLLHQCGHNAIAHSESRIEETGAFLESRLGLLLNEFNLTSNRNNTHLRALTSEFNGVFDRLTETVSARNLLERQIQVLERVLLSYDGIVQWKTFVCNILVDFHRFFPFSIFCITVSRENALSLYVFYPGQYSQTARETAQRRLAKQMLAALHLPADTLLDTEEFLLNQEEAPNSLGNSIQTIVMSVPEHTHNLGAAHVCERSLAPREQAAIRSILSVLTTVVSSSKMMSRTMAELEFHASHDPLTGLYNRRYFNSMLEHEIGRSCRHQHEFSILLLDIDNFKCVNDSYGHSMGDEALCGIARIIEQQLRKGDFAARLGGDEFAAILMETDTNGAMAVAEKLGRALRENIFISQESKTFFLTVSIGIVTYPHDAGNGSSLLAGVDNAMYQAKRLGKDNFSVLDGSRDKTTAH